MVTMTMKVQDACHWYTLMSVSKYIYKTYIALLGTEQSCLLKFLNESGSQAFSQHTHSRGSTGGTTVITLMMAPFQQLFHWKEAISNFHSYLCLISKTQHVKKLYSASSFAIHCTQEALCTVFSLFLHLAPFSASWFTLSFISHLSSLTQPCCSPRPTFHTASVCNLIIDLPVEKGFI